MPPGAPYHSFALPYPIRVDNFTDTLDDLPPPYNRPRLHLLTHTHSDHIAGLASKSFAHRVICSPDAKEMLLRHEVYAERSLHDHQYRAEKKKTFAHLKVDPYVMPNGQKLFTGSRDLLFAVPLNTPTEFDISESETVTITLIDANHCPGSVMFLIEGARGTILHTGDLRAEPWFLSSIQRNHFLQPYLASSSEDLQIFVARREGTHPEAGGLVKTLEAIYLDTACLLSPLVVPTKERAVQGIVGLMALFPSTTHFFINTWTWGYEDILKGIAHAFHCKIHFDRYKHSIYSHGSDPFLRALGTRDAASTRFHACERFDRCSFVDVPPYDYGAKGAVAPPSLEGKKVVYVNAVNMSCSRWEDYQANIKRRVSRGEYVDSLFVPLSRHSPLPELMNFVTLFRPLRVVPNTLDPSLNCLDWGAMSKMFSGCLSSVATPGCLVSVMAPPCPLTCHPSVTSAPGPSTKYDPRTFSLMGEEYLDTAYSNLVGPGDAAEQWGDKCGKNARMKVLRAWIGSGRRKGLGSMRRCVEEDEDAVLENNTDEHRLVAGPSRVTSLSRIAPRTPKRYAQSDDSGHSSDEGGSDNHAKTAWKLFGVGEQADAYNTWVSSSPQSQPQILVEAVVDEGTLPTPTSSPFFRTRRLEDRNKGKERAIEHASQSDLPLATPVKCSLERAPTEIALQPVTPDPCRLTSFVSACTSPLMSFEDVRVSGPSLDNVFLSDPSQDLVSSHPRTENRSQNRQAPRLHGRNLSNNNGLGNVGTEVDVENVGEAPPLKRRRVDLEGSEVKVGEKDGVRELGAKRTHLTPYGQDETCELPHKPSTGLTRTPTVPSTTNTDNKEASLAPSSSALEVESVLGAFPRSSPAPAVTAAPTIPFLSGSGRGTSSPRTCTRQGLVPGLASCSTSAIACAPALAVHRTSTIVRAKTVYAQTDPAEADASTRMDDAPVSPRTAARRAERAERRRITEKLRLARPDLVARAQPLSGSKSRGVERAAVPVLAVASTSTTALTSTSAYGMDTQKREANADDGPGASEEDVKMDWEKSRHLAERVREALKRGERVAEVLPRLRCLERWNAERM
ncbi:hypothetical protein HD554DRAFT_2145601 [Boletus coccyginus]|nr:hypothetical protein HD554DRAFT_2145601 [Boletus coccyginus]